jgi:hypothetical protein
MLRDGPSKAFLGAICICLAVALISVLISPYHPPQTAKIETAQQPEQGLETKQNSDGSKAAEHPRGGNKAEDGNNEASEFWTILGRRLKITDTLLVAFTFTLWWATRDLVVGSERTAKRQLRAYISVEMGTNFRQNRRVRFEFRPIVNNNGQTPANEVKILSKIQLRVCPETSRGIAKFSEHEAD